MSEQYIRPEEACKLLRITNRTLFNWDKQGKITCTRTPGNQRRILLSEVRRLLGENPKPKKYCYCRVSSHGQKKDLETQVEFFKSKYPNHTIIKDIGSGLNFNRKNFKTLLESAIRGNVQEIVVTHRDRLCRFGFELIEGLISKYSNGKIVVLDQGETSPEKELVSDLLSIITVFSSRLHGLRSYSIRKQIKECSKDVEDEIISEPTTEEGIRIDI